ncbi:MAG: AbrB/MazE/SpoVT family DNA-binding domain-containing protein [bacterium]
MQAKVFNKGQVVIPVSLRKKYKIRIGEKVNVIEEKDGIKIVPIKENTGIEKIQGIFNKYKKKKILTEKNIEKSTEKGFTEGYK